MSGAPILKVDFAKCQTAGECYYNHPDLFEMTEEGYPRLKVRHLETPDHLREAREAAEVCPARAITVEEG